jgi:hypothetical protein
MADNLIKNPSRRPAGPHKEYVPNYVEKGIKPVVYGVTTNDRILFGQQNVKNTRRSLIDAESDNSGPVPKSVKIEYEQPEQETNPVVNVGQQQEWFEGLTVEQDQVEDSGVFSLESLEENTYCIIIDGEIIRSSKNLLEIEEHLQEIVLSGDYPGIGIKDIVLMKKIALKMGIVALDR